jgi:quinol monooxygenase YgiN
MVTVGAVALAPTPPDRVSSTGEQTGKEESSMYGLIGKMVAVPGKRDALLEILLEGTGNMPGCRSYIVAKDPADADAIWITEVWESEALHRASLSQPAVKQAITRGRPLIARFGDATVTRPVGGYGLAPDTRTRSNQPNKQK